MLLTWERFLIQSAVQNNEGVREMGVNEENNNR
jgi:hypothetical protein